MPSLIDPTNPPSTERELDVRGALPHGLSGRLVGIGRDSVVHSFLLHLGRVWYAAHTIHTGAAVMDLVAFEGTVLMYGEDSSVLQLNIEFGTPRQVDLAGHRRTVAACPRYDSASGELHLVARDWDGAQTHVVVPAGALTRRSRSIVGTRAPLHGLAIGADHVVFVADSMAGVAPRDGDARTTWIPTDTAAALPIHTHRAGDSIILVALTPSLERWTLHPDLGTIEREVLDPTPRRCAHICDRGADGTPRSVWTTGDDTVGRHDLVHSRHAYRSLRPSRPGDFVVVADSARPDHADGGWFVGLVHDPSSTITDLCVIDAADIIQTVATIRIPRPIPHGLRCAWMPATQQ